MPPARTLSTVPRGETSSFPITDANNVVICPLENLDGSRCNKKCIGDKRYRSMQEHIRRAHNDYYISKLPATEESFLRMVNTPLSERPPRDQSSASAAQGFRDVQNDYRHQAGRPVTPRHSDEYSNGRGNHVLGTVTAATVLAEMHSSSAERDVETDRAYHSDVDSRRIPKNSIELPPLHQISNHDVTSDPFSNRPRDSLAPLLSGSPPGRSSTLPPLQRPMGPGRVRKQSISKRSREGHKKKNSRSNASDWASRIQNDDHMDQGARKALSAEPPIKHEMWLNLVAAAEKAQSAAGDLDDDRTPMPQSPVSIHRSSMPPFSHQNLHQSNYQASPLQQQALTPPSHNLEPYPSVESGENFHMGATGLSNSSPTYSPQNIQIYCAACRGVSLLRSSYACTECICGLCSHCVEVLMAEQGARRKCPRCATIGGRFKPFQLDIR